MPSSKPPVSESELRGGVRRTILDLLAESSLSAAELAERLDLHVTTVRFHLDRLVEAGLVARRRAADHRVGRPRHVWFVTAPATEAPAEGRRLHLDDLARVLLAGFHPDEDGRQVSPEAAGERWAAQHAREAIGISAEDMRPARTPGQWLGKVGRLMDLLDTWGYGPRLEGYDGGATVDVRLVDCPFLDLARIDPDVVCGIHAGVIRGAMAELGEPGADVVLEPFTDPPLCRARFTTDQEMPR